MILLECGCSSRLRISILIETILLKWHCTQFCQDQIRDDKAKMAKAVRKNVTIPKSSINIGLIIFAEFDLRREQESSEMSCVIQNMDLYTK